MVYYKTIVGSRYWHINTLTSDYDKYYVGDVAKKIFDTNFFPPHHTIVEDVNITILKICFQQNFNYPHEICELFPDDGNGLFYEWLLKHNENLISAGKIKFFQHICSLKENYEISQLSVKRIAYKFLILDLCYEYALLGDGHFKEAINKIRANNTLYQDIRLEKYSLSELQAMDKEKIEKFLSIKNFYLNSNFDEKYLKQCKEELHQLINKITNKKNFS